MRWRHTESPMVEEANQDLRLALPTTQIAVELLTNLARRLGTPPARSIHLDIVFNSSTGFSSGL
jgi:hypothetical protein